MKYQLIENYFQTKLFQIAVQDYFDTVLKKIIEENVNLPAKGLFEIDGKVKRDYYDMPYHIHVLNGLIPALFIYEKYLQEQGWIDSPNIDIYLRIFILGFTFHDANKLFQTNQTKEKSELELVIERLDNHVNNWNINEFLPLFKSHKSTVYHLVLATEDRTWVASEDYPITVNNVDEIKRTQRELCHFADKLASLQDESLESVEGLYKAVKKCLTKLSKITNLNLPISYVKIRPNPYLLLSQNLLQLARIELAKNNKRVLFTTREGFIFWGDDISEEEFKAIQEAYLIRSQDDIKYLDLTKITAQDCKFGFLGSAPFTKEILESIVTNLQNKFLALSPNSNSKIKDFIDFATLTRKIIGEYGLPIECEDIDNKLILVYREDLEDDDDENFRTIFNLHKIQWLNTKINKEWENDFDAWVKSKADLPEALKFKLISDGKNEEIKIRTIAEFLDFIKARVKSTNSLYKTYLNFIKTSQIIADREDIEGYVADLKSSIIEFFTPETNGDTVKKAFFDRYLEHKGNVNIQFLDTYNPKIPSKKEMCVFTGGVGEVEYKEEVAFVMKARGFSNKTITALNNNTSHVSPFFAEENKFRISNFNDKQANLIGFYDFFENNLSISKEIIKVIQEAKNQNWIVDSKVEFEKNVAFDYDLGFEFLKIKTSKKTTFAEGTFWFIRDHILMLKKLGVRSYITNAGSYYMPHKTAFHFNGAPLFIQKLSWDKVRLGDENEVLDEMKLMWDFGKKRLTNTLLKAAQNRSAYFRLFYTMNLKDNDKRNIENSLNEFLKKYKHKFPDMTITEELVKLAVQIDLAGDSSANETWLIRTATDYLRRYVKEEKEREDIIQKICGEINRRLRMKNPNPDAIEAFAKAVYDKLYQEDWNGKIPTINIEKDWIYQFAFLFKKQSKVEKHTQLAKKIKRELEDEGLEINEANVSAKLSDKAQRYTQDYLTTIKNL